MTSSIRRVGRDTLVYAAGTILARMLSLLMLPLYTRHLTPADYGVLQLLEMTVDIGTILIVAGMTAGLQKFYFEQRTPEEQRSLVMSAFTLEMGLGLLTTLMLILLAPQIWVYGLKRAGEVEFIQIAAVNFSCSLAAAVPLQWLQIERRSVAYIRLTILKLLAQVLLNIYFVAVLKWGVRGILATSFITNGLMGAGLAIWLLHRTGLRVRWDAMRSLRRFGLPYQATFLGSFVMTFGDRFFLQSHHGAAEVGLYSLAYSFGFLLYQVSSGPFLAAWNPQRFQDMNLDPAERDARYRRAFQLFNLGVLLVAAALALGIQPGLRIIAGPDFQSAARFVPIVLVAYVMQAWTDVVKFGIDVSGQTRYVSYASWISMALTLALYALLIPRWAGLGAAWATVGGFGLRFWLTYHWSQRLRPLPYEWRPSAELAAVGTALTLVVFSLPPLPLIAQGAIHTLLLGAFTVALWLRLLSADDRVQVRTMVTARWRALRAGAPS